MSLTFEEYGKRAQRHNICPDLGLTAPTEKFTVPLPVYETLGLTGEAGETAEKVKKALRDGHFDLVGYLKELGDTLWYVNASAEKVGFTLEEIAEMNMNKLDSRSERGVIRGSGDNR